MKPLYALTTFFLMILLSSANAQSEKKDSISNPQYDAALAKKLGADNYGMKKYYLVILKTGNNTNTDKELMTKSFNGHMENIRRLVKEGKLIVAGPLGKNDKTYRGIFIFTAIQTQEELEQILKTDSAISNGYLAYEIYNWYGSAALPEYLPYSDKVWKEQP